MFWKIQRLSETKKSLKSRTEKYFSNRFLDFDSCTHELLNVWSTDVWDIYQFYFSFKFIDRISDRNFVLIFRVFTECQTLSRKIIFNIIKKKSPRFLKKTWQHESFNFRFIFKHYYVITKFSVKFSLS